MKFILYIFFAMLFLSANSLAQSKESVIDAYFLAIGGKETWRTLQNIIRVGYKELKGGNPSNRSLSSDFLSNQTKFISYLNYPMQARTDNFKSDQLSRSSYDGKTFWVRINQESTQDMTKIMNRQTLFQGVEQEFLFTEAFIFLDYQNKKNYQIDFEESIVLKDQLYHILKVSMLDGRAFYYFFNANTHLLDYMSVNKQEFRNSNQYGDYRWVGKFLFPFQKTENVEGMAHHSYFTHIEVNSPTVCDELFDLNSDLNSFLQESVRNLYYLKYLLK